MLLNCVVGEDFWESLGLQGDQSWVFIGRTDAEAETLVLWPPNVKIWLIWEDPDAGKDWRREEKGETEDEMVGWHHRLNGHEFEWTPGVCDGQGGLACCSPWGRKESDMTEWLNQTELSYVTLSNAVPCYFPPCYKSTFYFWWRFNPQPYNKVELLGEVFSVAKTTWFSQYIFP